MRSISISKKELFSHPLFLGTILLTASGVLCRVIGFLYRIFLSREIGAVELGIYQLIFPWTMLLLSVCSFGIQSAISALIAKRVSRGNAKSILYAGWFLALSPAFLCSVCFLLFSKPLAGYILGDYCYASHLRILSFYILPASAHACINGYYYGHKKAKVPAFLQLFEQIARVASVVIFAVVLAESNRPLTAYHALWGLAIGEWFALLAAILFLQQEEKSRTNLSKVKFELIPLLRFSLPLTLNHAALHLCSCYENLLIPRQLAKYHYTQAEALGIFGVLTGMVMAIINLPCVLTNSLSVLLMPTISEAKACNNHSKIRGYVRGMLILGLGCGGLCTGFFFFAGNWIGDFLFQNSLAGDMIRRLSFLCPIMFLHSIYTGILQGLEKTKHVLFINLSACAIRCSFLMLLVPQYGISALLWSMLVSGVFCVVADLYLIGNGSSPSRK